MTPEKIKPIILCVAHGTIERNSGGVEVYQRLIHDELKDQFDFIFFAPDLHSGERGAYLLYSLDSHLRERFVFNPPVLQEQLSHPELEKTFEKILIRHRVSLVHFHHLLRQTPSLVMIPKFLGIPILFTVHDFYSICDEHTLLGSEGIYCGVLDGDFKSCDSCLFRIRGYRAGSQSQRVEAFRNALRQFDTLVFNTSGTHAAFLRLFSDLSPVPAKVIGAPSGTHFDPALKRSIVGNLKVLIPNGLSYLKGGDVLVELAARCQDLDIEFHFFGKTDRRYSEAKMKRSNSMVYFHGAYTRSQLEAFAPSAHVSIHASIWPETYCISLSEMWDLGVIPIGRPLKS